LNNRPDSDIVNESLKIFNKSLNLEKKNITEIGEGELVSNIEKDYELYCDSLKTFLNDYRSADKLIMLQKKSTGLNHQIILLSEMNERAIELKTSNAKVSANKALIQMTIIGIVCFLFALTFTYNFALYFNERFFQLYNGIKEIVSSNYGQRLYFDGKDEFYEISLLFNEMAEKLFKIEQERLISQKEPIRKEKNLAELEELKRILERIKEFEKQAKELIFKLDNKL
jgi:methyl-accepting chemotaxis protein